MIMKNYSLDDCLLFKTKEEIVVESYIYGREATNKRIIIPKLCVIGKQGVSLSVHSEPLEQVEQTTICQRRLANKLLRQHPR